MPCAPFARDNVAIDEVVDSGGRAVGLLFWVALVNGAVGLVAVGILLYLGRRGRDAG
jgi:hypothetical protein